MLSSSVANALELVGEEAKETARFAAFFDKFFDSLMCQVLTKEGIVKTLLRPLIGQEMTSDLRFGIEVLKILLIFMLLLYSG